MWKGGNMKDLCELCTLNCPTSGCTILSHESCLKEASQLIKPSVTNGEIFQAIFPNASVFENQDNESYPYIDVFLCGDKDMNCYRKDWWNAPYKTESEDKTE